MNTRLAQQFGVAAATVFGVTLLTFAVLVALPGDRVTVLIDGDQPSLLTLEQRALLRAELGLDRPWLVRYAHWLGRALHGDLGSDWQTGRPVAREIGERLGATLELSGAALALVLGVGVPLGWWFARRAGSFDDRWGSALLLALYAAPSFWIALLLQRWLAVDHNWLPLYGRAPAGGDTGYGVRLTHLVLPCACLAVHSLAFIARFARGTALAGSSGGVASTARALGLSEPRVFWQTGIRPSLRALAQVIGLLAPALVTGSVMIETAFAWPGLGQLFVGAVVNRNVPTVLGMTLLTATVTVGGSFLADALGRWATPATRTQAPRLGA